MNKAQHLIRSLMEQAELPRGEILYVHSRIKGLMAVDASGSYGELTKWMLDEMERLFAPKTILVPTYTYSFTQSGKYDRTRSVSEVGRFSEETRLLYPAAARTMNPVFSHVDTKGYFDLLRVDEESAFGEGSLMSHLHQQGHVIINFDVPELFGSYLHFLESKAAVPYRYNKIFDGTVYDAGIEVGSITYCYYVRDLNQDTKWRRQKIRALFQRHGLIHCCSEQGVKFQWLRSRELDEVVLGELNRNPRYLIEDEN